MEKQITCPHCQTKIEFKKDKKGRIIGAIAAGGIGYGLASGLGIAGAIAGATVAIPATIVGVIALALIGNKFGKDYDNNQPICPNCSEKLVL
ncbi:MAG: hypothetical protein L3J45_02065 [Flavobacteriaceae bacterium]|nr:hypothetical protein [Flavobacteriaceae bacterium]